MHSGGPEPPGRLHSGEAGHINIQEKQLDGLPPPKSGQQALPAGKKPQADLLAMLPGIGLHHSGQTNPLSLQIITDGDDDLLHGHAPFPLSVFYSPYRSVRYL